MRYRPDGRENPAEGLRETSRPIPNFFLVGAPRCGTTSVYSYLSNHPDVFMPYQKEPMFFGADMTKTPNEFMVLEEEKYLRLFRRSGNYRVRGEASVMYLYSKTAAEEIHRFNPAARIIIMLRNPVDVVYSYHGQLHWGGYEDIPDFEEALAAEPDRRAGRRIPRHALVPEALRYSEIGMFGEQVERYLRVFPRNQVKIVMHEDLAGNPETTYFSILDFLGIDHIPAKSYDCKNPHKEPRSITVSAWCQRPPAVLRPFVRIIPQPLRKFILAHIHVYLNTRYLPRPEMRPELRQRMIDFYAEDIQKLSSLIKRDLSDWLKVADSGSERPQTAVSNILEHHGAMEKLNCCIESRASKGRA